jgi:hypothetical protein
MAQELLIFAAEALPASFPEAEYQNAGAEIVGDAGGSR